jgi:predicted alpha/beta hydrolase
MFDSVALNQGKFEVSALSWGARDLTSVIAWCETRFPGVAVTCIGHSLGGHIVALSESVRKLRRLVLVTCGSVYWGFRPTLISKVARIGFWYLLLPASTYFFGRFPGRLLSIMDDLPRDVALQWARWCRHPGYLKGAESDATHFDAVVAPVLSLHFDDDKEIPFRAVQAFAACFPKTPVEVRLVSAAAVPDGRIGHFNFFRAKVAATLWPDLFAWLTA